MNGHEVLPELKCYGHGVMIFLIYGLTLSDRHHGGEALQTNKDFYHVQGGEMINMVECLELMVNLSWRNDARIFRVFLGLYHAKGIMIPTLVLSVDRVMDGLHNTYNKIPQVKVSSTFKYY